MTQKKDVQLLLLEQIADAMRELVTWTRVVSYPTVKQVLETALDTEKKRQVYHLTDGQHGVKAIQDVTGVNARYISEWWQEWERINIVEQSHHHRKGRRVKLFDLASLGLAIPDNLVSAQKERKK